MHLPPSYWDVVVRGLPAAVVRHIDAAGHRKRYPAKTLLFGEGLDAGKIMVIRTGRARSFYRTVNGRESTVILSRPGGILGLVALLTRQPISISIAALTTVEVMEFGADDYRDLLEEVPLFALRNAEVLAYMYGANTRRTRLNLDPADVRLVKVLLQLCSDGVSAQSVIAGYSHESIAAMADVSRCWATQKLNQLQREGLIVLGRMRIEVREFTSLQAYASAGLNCIDGRPTVHARVAYGRVV